VRQTYAVKNGKLMVSVTRAIAETAIKSGHRPLNLVEVAAMVPIRPDLPARDRQHPTQSLDAPSQRVGVPTMYDLPSDDPEEPRLPDEFYDL
jgi:hypothetical protein